MPEAGVPLVVLLHLSLDVVESGLKMGCDFFPFLLLQTRSLYAFILWREKGKQKKVRRYSLNETRVYLSINQPRESLYLECPVVSLQLSAQTLQLAASQDGLAVLVPEVVLVLDQLVLLLLQRSHLFLGVTVLFQLPSRKGTKPQ